MLALVLRRSRRAVRGQEFPARLLHPLLRPGRHDRAGRHGELELRDGREPRHDRPTAPPPPSPYEQGIGNAVENFEWQGMRDPGRVVAITDVRSSEEPARNLY